MILLAESGSTKTQWALIDKHQVKFLTNTSGINPLLMSRMDIETIMRPQLANVDPLKLQSIRFYGAGCALPNVNTKIKKALNSIFLCDNIEVDTDLKAACLALAENKPGIIGLLGTGSNSCVWDGKKVTERIPSLGYVLGDEGGGVSLGKKLIKDYLKQEMPEELMHAFNKKYQLTATYVLDRVYQKPMPNKFLAGFAPFIEKHIKTEYCQQILREQFDEFIRLNILKYPGIKENPLYFCGSIAHFHQDILEQCCKNFDLKISRIVKAPIEPLAEYFQKIIGEPGTAS